MIAITIDGYTLLALVIVGLVVLIFARIVARIMRDHGVRVARIGVFVERERIIEAAEEDSHSLDPFDDKTEVINVPREPDWPRKEGE